MDLRQLNRASLERQLLLERTDLPVATAVDRLAGMQAQAPNAPYVGLMSRLADFRPDELATALTDRTLVRTSLLRGTIHLVSAADAVAWYPLVRPVLERGFASNFRPRLPGVDVAELVAEATELLSSRAWTRTELGARLAASRPGSDPSALAYAATYLVPVVQVPPRAVWGRSAPAAWLATPAWLPDTHTHATLADLVRRCLAAFGPATVRDIQTWCGLTRLREVTDQIGDELRTYPGEHGTLYDLPDATLPDPETPAPPRFLPEYDNLLLSYADRDRVGAGHRPVPLPPGIGGTSGSLLVDGFWQAGWRLENGSTLVIEPFHRLARADVAAVTEEGHRLLGLIAADADDHRMVFATP